MAENSNLANFLIRLETDEGLLKKYKEDPVGTMTEQELSPEEQDLVLEGSEEELREYLGDGVFWIIRPVPKPKSAVEEQT